MNSIGPASATARDATALSAPAGRGGKTVLMLAGGGLSHTSGGVGTLIGYLIGCWASDPDGPAVRVLDTRGDGGVAGGAWAFARALATLVWQCVAGRAALVHAHMTTRGSVIRKCLLCATANLLGVPTVIHQHGADFHSYFRRQARPVRRLIRAILNGSKGVVVLGESWRDFLIDEVGVEPRKIRIVANGVPKPARAVRQNAGAAVRPTILFLGRLGNRKGVPELLAALGQDRVRSREWRAILAGDGEVERFRQEVAAAGLSDRVEVLGWQDRGATTALLEEAQIVVLPSHHEAMPVAILEALSHGIAVIATPVGVIPEFLRDRREALLVPAGDIERLGDALTALLDDPQARSELAAAGNRMFLARLEIGSVAQKLLALYREAAASPKASDMRVERFTERQNEAP